MKRRLFTRLLFLATCGLAAAGAASSCTIVNGLHVPDPDGGGDTPDTGPAGPVDGGVDADQCPHDVPPGPPKSATAGDGPVIVAVIRKVDLGENRSTDEHVGRDLDYSCTCHGTPAGSCITPGPQPIACDDTHGRDNDVASMLDQLRAASSLTGAGYSATDSANKALAGGSDNLVIRVQGYNGQPDDNEVTVSFLPSLGPRDADGGALGHAPNFDDEVDFWAMVGNAFVNEPTGGDPGSDVTLVPKVTDRNAYVTGGTLVAHLGKSEVRLASGVVTHLTDTIFTATFTKVQGNFVVDTGLLTGRWEVADALKGLGEVPLSAPSNDSGAVPLCKQDFVMQSLIDAMCHLADVMVDSTKDFTGASCDGLSLAMQATFAPAKVGKIETFAPAPSNCGGRTFSCDGGIILPPDAGSDAGADGG